MSEKKPPGTRRGSGRGRGRAPSPRPPGPLEESEAPKNTQRGRGRGRGGGSLLTQAAEAEGLKEGKTVAVGGESKQKKSEEIAFAIRSGYGQSGRKIKLETNHFEVRLDPARGQMTAYRYDVLIEQPRIKRKLTRDDNRLIFWTAVVRFTNQFPNRYMLAYDGQNALFSLDRLPFRNGVFKETFDIATVRDRLPGLETVITISSPQEILVDFRETFTDGEQELAPLQLLDAVTRQGRSLFGTGLPQRGGPWYCFGPTSYVIPDNVNRLSPLGGGCFVWFGIFSSAHVAQIYRPFLNMDVSNGAFYHHGKLQLIQFMLEVLNDGLRNPQYFVHDLNLQTMLNRDEERKFRKAVTGLKVRRNPREGIADRQYRVFELCRNAVETSFNIRQGDGTEVQVTVAQYFQSRYGPLQYPKLQLLNLGSKKRPCYVPLEECYLEHPQRCAKKLSEGQVSNMIRVAALPAPKRRDKIYEMRRTAQLEGDPWLTAFGVTVSKEMEKLEGRVLPSPKVQYSPAGGRNAFVETKSGEWPVANQKMFVSGVPLIHYGLIVPHGMKEEYCSRFFRLLSRVGYEMGLEIAPGPANASTYTQRTNMEEKITEVLSGLTENQNGLKFLFVITTSKSGGVYAETKRVADVVKGAMTQCLQRMTVEKDEQKLRQTLQNIVLKINAKMGGINNRLVPEGIWSSVTQPNDCTLFIGVDVSVPPGFDKTTPSVAAVVSNVNLDATRYTASIMIRKSRVMDLTAAIKQQLIAFFQETGKLKPSRIIYYREGVSESQYQEVLSNEMASIREACIKLSAETEYRPQITFIIVTKRHHTRFFCLSRDEAAGRNGNIPPGTMVDKAITSPKFFDFYLCSHFGVQGTSVPIRYTVLHDDSGFKPDDIQMLTYSLSNVYCRCARSVSIPTPLYYAHWASLRAKHHLHAKVADFGSDTMSVASGAGSQTVSEADLMNNATVHENMKMQMYFV